MKEHAKKALKHDVEVLGKTVPTIAVLALFLIGSGSAAVLTNFGTVTGDAGVTQAVTLNGEDAQSSDFDQTWSYSVVGGDTAYETNTLNNNLNDSVTVMLDSSVTGEPTTDASTSDESALTVSNMLLENGMAVDRVRENSDPQTSEAEAEYVSYNGAPAVRAQVDANAAHASAGLWFEADSAELTAGETSVSVQAEEGPNHEGSTQVPDWIVLGVEDESTGTEYLVYSATVDTTGQSLTWNGSTFEGNYAAVYEVTNSLQDDFGQVEKTGPVDVNATGMDIEYTGTMTGTTGNGVYDIYYSGFSFNGESIVQTGNSVDVPSGDSELGTVVDADVAAVPGTYTVGLDVKPDSGQTSD
ncbi:MAG: hypothetical protein ACI9LV_000456 [Candidatus Nanohaloarchaea archaeon]|jgi:hypothetical protein